MAADIAGLITGLDPVQVAGAWHDWSKAASIRCCHGLSMDVTCVQENTG
jgi:hypothetical protein